MPHSPQQETIIYQCMCCGFRSPGLFQVHDCEWTNSIKVQPLLDAIQARHTTIQEMIGKVKKLKMCVDESTIDFYEDPDVAKKTLERNRVYDRAIDDVLALLTQHLEGKSE